MSPLAVALAALHDACAEPSDPGAAGVPLADVARAMALVGVDLHDTGAALDLLGIERASQPETVPLTRESVHRLLRVAGARAHGRRITFTRATETGRALGKVVEFIAMTEVDLGPVEAGRRYFQGDSARVTLGPRSPSSVKPLQGPSASEADDAF